MVTMVTIKPVRTFKGSAVDAAVFKKVKEAGSKRVDYNTAIEAIHNSGGMYEIISDATAPNVAAVELDGMSTEQLKVMYFQLGAKRPNGKQIRRSDMIQAIRLQLESIEVVDDEVAVDEGDEG